MILIFKNIISFNDTCVEASDCLIELTSDIGLTTFHLQRLKPCWCVNDINF